MKKALIKDSLKEIKKSYKRFISILLMAFMGVGFFAGVRATSPDMKKTLDLFLDKHNVYDIKILSTLGLTKDDVSELEKVPNVEKVYGFYNEDVYVSFGEEQTVVKIYEINSQINTVDVIDGKLPENIDECVIEEAMHTGRNINIGDFIDIEENLEEDEDPTFINTKLKVVGIVRSPLYISRDRGTTTLGSGKIAYYMYVNKDNIDSKIFSEVNLSVLNSRDLNSLDSDYENLIENTKNEIEKIKEARQLARYNELVAEATEKLDDAQKEFDEEKSDAEKKIEDAKQEIADGKKEIADNEKKLQDAQKELTDGRNTAATEFANAENQINDAQNQLILAQEEINDGNAYFAAKEKEAEEGKKQIQSGIDTIIIKTAELEEQKKLTENVISGLNTINETLNMLNEQLANYQNELLNTLENREELEGMIDYLNTQIELLQAQKQEFEAYGITQETLNQINAGISECNAQRAMLEKQIASIDEELTKGKNELLAGQNQVSTAWEKLMASKAELESKKAEANQKFADAEKEITDGKKKIADAKIELADGENELNEKIEEFNTKIADAEEKLIDAREKVNDIENAKWYILDRDSNAGFSGFSQDTDNIEKLGDVFPIVFFIIATLISLTSMTRMVEEERVQIGTLKAMGYKNSQIVFKYVLYSLLAAICGGILGAIFGLQFFPNVIISMYKMMYDIKDIVIEFNKYFTILGIGTMSLCMVGATLFTAYKELLNTPAEMMRPKSPKAGKRVLFEKIPFLWNRFNFTQKVTLRNMFRYKKRFLMTVIGIMGCTALILVGFGLKDSISKIMDYQYVDIYDYDMLIGLKNTLTGEEISTLKSELENKEKIEKCVEVYMTSETAKNGDNEEDVQLIVTKNPEELDEVIKLKDLKTGEKLQLNDNEVIITDKLAQLINAKAGDEISLLDSDNNEYKVKVSAVTEHYIAHYIYMTENLYKNLVGEDISTNIFFTKYSNEIDEETESNLSKELLKNSKIASVTLTSYLMETMDDTLSAMNLVVYVLIVSAGLLAFIVLYNLANVNISERIRELATIKVLGFYDKEVYNYITREIVLLTIIGILFGLVFGYILNSFILGTCEIGILRFKRIILPQSYLFAALITVVFTYIVNWMTYFALKKIDMIEALKSVE